ncbi:MAG: hypothetical protein RBJ76_00720 [Stenomitos frigidus ULC029]
MAKSVAVTQTASKAETERLSPQSWRHTAALTPTTPPPKAGQASQTPRTPLQCPGLC